MSSMNIFQKVTKLDFSRGLLFLILSGFVSTILSISIDMTGYELGALLNYIWPAFLTIITIIVFGICCLIFKNVMVRF